MKKVLFALFVISASTFTIQESKATEDTEPQMICCESENDCDHPKYGKVFLSTLQEGSTCTVY